MQYMWFTSQVQSLIPFATWWLSNFLCETCCLVILLTLFATCVVRRSVQQHCARLFLHITHMRTCTHTHTHTHAHRHSRTHMYTHARMHTQTDTHTHTHTCTNTHPHTHTHTHTCAHTHTCTTHLHTHTHTHAWTLCLLFVSFHTFIIMDWTLSHIATHSFCHSLCLSYRKHLFYLQFGDLCLELLWKIWMCDLNLWFQHPVNYTG